MQIPLELSYHGTTQSPALEDFIEKKVTRLNRICPEIISCRVAIETPHHHHRKGNRYHVRLDVSVPGRELVVGHNPGDTNAHEDPYVVVRDAFDALERQIKSYKETRRNEVKKRAELPEGRISNLESEEGFGLIQDERGQEVYFHRDCLINCAFDALSEGDLVHFHAIPGVKGLRATTVFWLGE